MVSKSWGHVGKHPLGHQFFFGAQVWGTGNSSGQIHDIWSYVSQILDFKAFTEAQGFLVGKWVFELLHYQQPLDQAGPVRTAHRPKKLSCHSMATARIFSKSNSSTVFPRRICLKSNSLAKTAILLTQLTGLSDWKKNHKRCAKQLWGLKRRP